MRLLYGTYNPGKLEAMRLCLQGLDIALIGLTDLQTPPADVEETGNMPRENARLKALSYSAATGMTTLSADSALFFENVPDAEQPGVHARRMQGGRMDDDAMIAFYCGLIRRHGGRVTARYRNALCIAFADGRLAQCDDESVASSPFYLVDTPHTRRTAGFPLDSLSVEITSGQYYFDLADRFADRQQVQNQGIRRFVQGALGLAGAR